RRSILIKTGFRTPILKPKRGKKARICSFFRALLVLDPHCDTGLDDATVAALAEHIAELHNNTLGPNAAPDPLCCPRGSDTAARTAAL
ncbi:hypothetical protein, partial [Azospirillum formosense]|uniref:hypothetical protein n=1 Tax=Azospirillum formosense TaxID=861533 RepID=UPI0031EEE8D2